jgi:hypothetical protein
VSLVVRDLSCDGRRTGALLFDGDTVTELFVAVVSFFGAFTVVLLETRIVVAFQHIIEVLFLGARIALFLFIKETRFLARHEIVASSLPTGIIILSHLNKLTLLLRRRESSQAGRESSEPCENREEEEKFHRGSSEVQIPAVPRQYCGYNINAKAKQCECRHHNANIDIHFEKLEKASNTAKRSVELPGKY